jgi:hypothetical protein
MAVNDKISKLVASQFPSFYKEDGANFLQFIEAYYAWMETTGQMTDGIRNLESYRDISTTTNDFIDYFTKTFLPSVPTSILADKKLAVKNVKYFNESRGTFEAYKLMFRAVFGEDIDLNLPADQILIVSDGDWVIDRYVTTQYDDANYSLIGQEILGVESGATALVEDIIRRRINGKDIMQILLSNIIGTFGNLENIRLSTDTNSNGQTPVINAGISTITISTGGARYQAGDVVDLVSNKTGLFGKVIVTNVEQLNGALTFTITEGGSGYRTTTSSPGSEVTITGGLGTDATFSVNSTDLTNSFALFINSNKINNFTQFSTLAPRITNTDSKPRRMSRFANTIIAAPRYGFPEVTVDGIPSGSDYHEYANSVLRVANTKAIAVGASLFGNSSLANATVQSIISGTAGNAYLKVTGYKKFTALEGLNMNFNSGASAVTVGNVTSYSANTFGSHVLTIANTFTISVGDELVGVTSKAFGTVTKVIGTTLANTFVHLSANSTSNLTSQFSSGPIKAFANNENIRKVGSATVVGVAKNRTSNVETEDVHTRLADSFTFKSYSIGTVQSLSTVNAGSGYRTSPTVTLKDNDVSSLEIKQFTLRLHNNNVNFSTGNSNFTVLSAGDKIVQASTGAQAYVMGSNTAGEIIKVTQLANNTYETSVRVWQELGVIANFANNAAVQIETYAGSYTQGGSSRDTRTKTNDGTATLVLLTNNGTLGDNAVITPTIGANGSVVSVKVSDSGFNYEDGETVTIASSGRALAEESTGVVTLSGAANSEGYYSSSKSHLSTSRGIIQDSRFYQEFSYEIIAPVALARYRDIALKLVHPAGQALFGKYRLQSNVFLNVATVSESKRREKANGTIAVAQNSFNITGTGTSLTSHYANGGEIIIAIAPSTFYTMRLNKVTNTTFANTTTAWSNSNITTANLYYTTSASSANIYYQVT